MQKQVWTVHTIIHEKWPSCYCKGTDWKGWAPKKREVDDLLLGTYFSQYEYTAKLMECEDLAIVVMAFIRQERYHQMKKRKLPPEQWLNWLAGFASVDKLNNRDTNHALNFVFTRDCGLMLFDGRTGLLKEANNEEDTVWFTFM